MGQHDAKMRADIWKQINAIYTKIYYLEQKLRVLEARKEKLAVH